jgi:hypothetical protein
MRLEELLARTSPSMGLVLGLLVALAAPGATTAADLYDCTFSVKSANGNWIGDRVYVRRESGKDEVEVIDGVIAYFNENRPLAGKIDTDNAKRTTFTWTIRTKSSTNQYANMVYRMTMMKASRTASITAQALNYAGPYSSEGKCKVGKVE